MNAQRGAGRQFAGVIFQDTPPSRVLATGTDKAMIERQCKQECDRLNKHGSFTLAWSFVVLPVELEEY